MKWPTPVLPYLAVIAGMFWFRNAWVGLVGFHLEIVVSLWLARSSIPLRVLIKSTDIRWVLLSILLSSSSGIILYFFWSSFGVAEDLSTQLQALGLSSSSWTAFIAYFTLANPFLEEYFWRGYLGSSTNSSYISDFVYAGFHAFILLGKTPPGSIAFSLTILVLAGWFWRQVAREDQGLLAPVLGHMAADFTILMTIYSMST